VWLETGLIEEEKKKNKKKKKMPSKPPLQVTRYRSEDYALIDAKVNTYDYFVHKG
jgi:hypothetical protein